MTTSPFPSLTKVWHSQSYPGISPSRHELSAKDKTVVVTGGGTGIGAGIAKAFAAAGSTKIAIMSRTERTLVTTREAIKEEYPKAEVLVVVADMTIMNQVDEGFNKIRETFGEIHVLVNNAGFLPVPKVVFAADFDIQDWWTSFTTNVLGALHIVRAFSKHASQGACLLNISTAIAHMPPLEVGISGYAASKAAAVKLFDLIALENPDLHVVNIHPGLVESTMSRKSGHGGFDNVDLPSHFCVWAASPEARFLRGKYLWVNWDVNELKARKEELMATDLLDVKLGGLSFVGWGGVEV